MNWRIVRRSSGAGFFAGDVVIVNGVFVARLVLWQGSIRGR
jgi:hypothetical protein